MPVFRGFFQINYLIYLHVCLVDNYDFYDFFNDFDFFSRDGIIPIFFWA